MPSDFISRNVDAGCVSNLYGGLSQQEPYDPKSIMSRLRRLAKEAPGICYPGQYDNDDVCYPYTAPVSSRN
jgi:hypothetical protein